MTPITSNTWFGNLVDISNQQIYPAEVQVTNGVITKITHLPSTVENTVWPFLLPGFIDAHVHIESSMLIPAQFAKMAVVHGTVATVSDPHEIANVCGRAGVDFMIENGKTVPFKFFFGAPSCVPATTFETAGAALSVDEVAELLQHPDIRYLSEMMNFPGVLSGDAEVLAKIATAKSVGKVVDGHAPGLRGDALQQYIDAGITTDHECFTLEEATEKLQRGMQILIREGSAARNFDELIPLLEDWPERILFCSDDKHPDSLLVGHINQLCARAIAKGINLYKVLQAACLNPIRHYSLQVGKLQIGDPADAIFVKDLVQFEVLATWINGQLVAQNGQSLIIPPAAHPVPINHFNCSPIFTKDLAMVFNGNSLYPVIGAIDGQLITQALQLPPMVVEGNVVPDINNDILKIVVVNRYSNAPIAKGLIKNFGLKKGAIASSVAHDSHNIVAIGCDDASLSTTINSIIAAKGGLAATNGNEQHLLPLPVAGIMTQEDGNKVAATYTQLDQFSKKVLGSTLKSPFMTLSFMALLVIPALKMSDKGMFDGNRFSLVE